MSNKLNEQDSDSLSSPLSSRTDLEENSNETSTILTTSDPMIFNYKCSLCDYQSNNSWNVQKHINELHAEFNNTYVLTQCRQTKSVSNDISTSHIKNIKTKTLNGQNRSLSPASAVAKAKFSPAVEEVLLSLQGSKLNRHVYAVQPKFGIKRLKCRHCFYRSNWKTDMIRHVRIRHNITEPDHHKGKEKFI